MDNLFLSQIPPSTKVKLFLFLFENFWIHIWDPYFSMDPFLNPPPPTPSLPIICTVFHMCPPCTHLHVLFDKIINNKEWTKNSLVGAHSTRVETTMGSAFHITSNCSVLGQVYKVKLKTQSKTSYQIIQGNNSPLKISRATCLIPYWKRNLLNSWINTTTLNAQIHPFSIYMLSTNLDKPTNWKHVFVTQEKTCF